MCIDVNTNTCQSIFCERRCRRRRRKMTESVFGICGEKVGVVVQEGGEWVAYNMSDVEVYRGLGYLEAAWTLQGRA